MQSTDRAKVLQRIMKRPFVVAPTRDWKPADVSAYWCKKVDRGFGSYEVLLDGKGFIILQHGLTEVSTGQHYTQVLAPSWPNGDALLREAAERAARHGSKLLKADLNDHEWNAQPGYASAGFQAEREAIVLRLFPAPDIPDTSAIEGVCARDGTADDRLYLTALATDCVPFMYGQRERADTDALVGVFIDQYLSLDFSPASRYRLWVVENRDGILAGAVLIDLKAEDAVDGRKQAFIYNISITPDAWGRAFGAVLGVAFISAVADMGYGYLTGDISTENARVKALATRFNFMTELRRCVQIL